MSRLLLLACALTVACDETAGSSPDAAQVIRVRADAAVDSAAPPARDASTADAEADLGLAPDLGIPPDRDSQPADVGEVDAADPPPVDAASAEDAADPPPTDAATPDAAAPDAGAAPLYQGDAPIYAPGPLAVRVVEVAEGQAVRPLTIYVPEADGRYAVVVFQHGFILSTAYYATRLRHLASHGFIVVAPQMYAADGLPFGKPTAAEETQTAGRLVDWLIDNLGRVAGADAATDHLGLAGHSRGGKVAWGVLLADPTRALAIAGLDPVDGMGGPLGGEPRLIDGAFALAQPALVIGTGLGPTGFVPCAPAGDNHEQFYGASPGPAWHVVGPDHGHNDLLDPNIRGCLACGACPSGRRPDDFGRAVFGQLVAFFRATLQGDDAALGLLVGAGAPAPLNVESK